MKLGGNPFLFLLVLTLKLGISFVLSPISRNFRSKSIFLSIFSFYKNKIIIIRTVER